MIQSYRLLVTGTPRSGTTYMSKILREVFGLDCPHEKLGPDGTVSSFYCVSDQDDYCGPHGDDPPASEVRFERKIRLVRDPVGNIRSMQAYIAPGFWLWQERHTKLVIVPEGCEATYKPTLDEVALFYVAWHNQIPFDVPVVRLEDIANIRPRENVGGGRLEEQPISPEPWKAVKELAVQFGY